MLAVIVLSWSSPAGAIDASVETSLLQLMDQLEARVAQLEAENDQLRRRGSVLAVSPEGRVLSSEYGADGRRLSAAQCCRWTPDGTCGAVAESREYGCTLVRLG